MMNIKILFLLVLCFSSVFANADERSESSGSSFFIGDSLPMKKKVVAPPVQAPVPVPVPVPVPMKAKSSAVSTTRVRAPVRVTPPTPFKKELTLYTGVISFKEDVNYIATTTGLLHDIKTDSLGQGLGGRFSLAADDFKLSTELFVYKGSATAYSENADISYFKKINFLGVNFSLGPEWMPKGQEGGYTVGLKLGAYMKTITWQDQVQPEMVVEKKSNINFGASVDSEYKTQSLLFYQKIAVISGYKSVLWQLGVGYSFY